MFRRGLVRGRREMLIASPAAPSFRNNETISRPHEVMQQLARVGVVNDRAHWHGELDRFAVAPCPLAAFTVAAAFCFVFGIEPEMQQGVVVLACQHYDIPSAAAIAAARASAGNILLAPERKASVSAVAGLYRDSNFIDEHRLEAKPVS